MRSARLHLVLNRSRYLSWFERSRSRRSHGLPGVLPQSRRRQLSGILRRHRRCRAARSAGNRPHTRRGRNHSGTGSRAHVQHCGRDPEHVAGVRRAPSAASGRLHGGRSVLRLGSRHLSRGAVRGACGQSRRRRAERRSHAHRREVPGKGNEAVRLRHPQRGVPRGLPRGSLLYPRR